jgi:hypothetical protein
VGVFGRVLVGVDGTDYGLEALHQALTLGTEDGVILAVTALDITPTVHVGWDSSRLASMLGEDAERARAGAAEVLRGRRNADARIVRGSAQTVWRPAIEAGGGAPATS